MTATAEVADQVAMGDRVPVVIGGPSSGYIHSDIVSAFGDPVTAEFRQLLTL